MSDGVVIRPAIQADAACIAAIYNYYVANTIITFEQDVVSDDSMASRIEAVGQVGLPWLVAEFEGGVQAYAYATEWKARFAYRYTVEVTVYVGRGSESLGFGSRLYAALFDALKASSVHVALAGIALPNDASVALHEKIGMKKVAKLEQVGYKLSLIHI